MNAIPNYSTYLVTAQFWEDIPYTNVNIPRQAEDLGDEGRPNDTSPIRQWTDSNLYRARKLPDTDDALLYQNDPDPLIRYKHFLLGIEMLITIIPRAVVASFICLAKLFMRVEITRFDTPLYNMRHQISLFRWNLVGLIFPQFGRMHFGDEERKRHVDKGIHPTLTLDLKGNERILDRITQNIWGKPEKNIYYAPCFQPVMRIATLVGTIITTPQKKPPSRNYLVKLKTTTYTWCFRTVITR